MEYTLNGRPVHSARTGSGGGGGNGACAVEVVEAVEEDNDGEGDEDEDEDKDEDAEIYGLDGGKTAVECRSNTRYRRRKSPSCFTERSCRKKMRFSFACV